MMPIAFAGKLFLSARLFLLLPIFIVVVSVALALVFPGGTYDDAGVKLVGNSTSLNTGETVRIKNWLGLEALLSIVVSGVQIITVAFVVPPAIVAYFAQKPINFRSLGLIVCSVATWQPALHAILPLLFQ